MATFDNTTLWPNLLVSHPETYKTLMERKKAETKLFHQSVATLYATRNVEDPDERAAMLSTATTDLNASSRFDVVFRPNPNQ